MVGGYGVCVHIVYEHGAISCMGPRGQTDPKEQHGREVPSMSKGPLPLLSLYLLIYLLLQFTNPHNSSPLKSHRP